MRITAEFLLYHQQLVPYGKISHYKTATATEWGEEYSSVTLNILLPDTWHTSDLYPRLTCLTGPISLPVIMQHLNPVRSPLCNAECVPCKFTTVHCRLYYQHQSLQLVKQTGESLYDQWPSWYTEILPATHSIFILIMTFAISLTAALCHTQEGFK